MRSHKHFDGMDLNTKEKAICRDNPIGAMQLYRRRTGLGLKDARDALEQELGMDPIVYRRVRDRMAFAVYYQDYLWYENGDGSEKHFQLALKFWRSMKRSLDLPPWKGGKHSGECTNEPCSCQRCSMEQFYEMAEKILDLDDLSLDEEDPRNWNTKTI